MNGFHSKVTVNYRINLVFCEFETFNFTRLGTMGAGPECLWMNTAV